MKKQQPSKPYRSVQGSFIDPLDQMRLNAYPEMWAGVIGKHLARIQLIHASIASFVPRRNKLRAAKPGVSQP